MNGITPRLGHGRCYDLSPDLSGEDEDGYGTVPGGGQVPAGREDGARLATADCPESAVAMPEAALRRPSADRRDRGVRR
ncbi:ferredoxin [Blastococcus sp. HT6-30]|uniref:ferredoxin n=1 Tax=Blastococcus sp. HT6-30 TaxID=3144843 RepID=UPI003219AE4A